MNSKWKLVLAGAGLATLVGLSACLKAGDGIGVEPDGTPNPCARNPKSSACTVYTCKKTPTDKMCVAPVKTSFALDVFPIIKSSTHGCTGCHGHGMGGLQMEDGDATLAYNNLVNVAVNELVPATGGGAPTDTTIGGAPGWVRVKPGSPDSSMLYLKLASRNNWVIFDPTKYRNVSYGNAMPLYNDDGKFSLAELEIVRKWILEGALP